MQTEANFLHAILRGKLNEAELERLATSSKNILSKTSLDKPNPTVLALGYVQSGKTTQMVSLAAEAYDAGYKIIIAMLGTTNLLLDQNTGRFIAGLSLDSRTDYKWSLIKNPKTVKHGQEMLDKLSMGKVLIIPLLKHSKRIYELSEVLKNLNLTIPVLILDDEADQASLNAKVNVQDESETYKSITALRNALSKHLFVQFTATPYAPLLLEQDDHLTPDYVEMLIPGDGYTGGKEFFILNADKVIRNIPASDEQTTRGGSIAELPKSLKIAFANFFAGAALLLLKDQSARPTSMLIHSTHRKDIQAKYLFLLKRLHSNWKTEVLNGSLPKEIIEERVYLVSKGVQDFNENEFFEKLKYVITQTEFWLVNSASDVKTIKWNEAPIHVLVGGNKLDRGFTVEGLTVTYMNRPPGSQIDTIEQRARAFGYRGDLLPYCQFFATRQTVKALIGIVATEYDLRAKLSDWLANGGTPSEWAKQIGLLMPVGMRPTRANVVMAISEFNTGGGWHQLRTPSLDQSKLDYNFELVKQTGVLVSEKVNYGRLSHRTIHIPRNDALSFIQSWKLDEFNPGWEISEILDLMERVSKAQATIPIVYLDGTEDGVARIRTWNSGTGFVNLMQGKDTTAPSENWYPGDRKVPDIDLKPGEVAIQVHHVVRRGDPSNKSILTICLYLGESKIVSMI